MTAQRRIVARILSTSHDHPNVEELYRRVRRIDSQIALSTVYRIVHVLLGIGIVEKLNLGSGGARLEVVPTKHHDHLIDVRSSKVIEFRSDEIERLLPQIANHLGYRLVEYRLVLHGIPLDETRLTALSNR